LEFVVLPRGVTMRVAALSVAVLFVMPAAAAAQKDAFFDALLPLSRALRGVYGDEGARILAQIETMAAALERWDAEIGATERALRAQLAGADPNTALQVHTGLAALYLDRGRFADALREFDEDLLIDPKRAAFHRLRAVVLQALNRPRNAADAFRSAWLLEPDDPQHAYHLIVRRSAQTTAAEVTRAVGTLAAVEQALTRGERARADAPFISVRPINDDAGADMVFAPAAYARAFRFLLTGELDAGMTTLREAATADPLVADAALRLEPAARGIDALRQGNLAEAIQQIEAARARAPQSAQIHRILGTAYGVSGDIPRSLQRLREAVGLDPRDERSWLALARTLDDSGNWPEAADVLRKGVATLPDSGELRWQLSIMSGRRQRTDEADLALIVEADRFVLLAGTGELHGRVASLAQAHLEYERGLTLLEQRVAVTPNNAAAHLALGRAYVDLGREAEGFAELVAALWLDPMNPDVLTAVGRLHLVAGRHPAAIEALTRAAALAPTSAEAVHALGEALTRAGKTDEGRRRLVDAERLRNEVVDTQRRLRTAGMLSLEAEVQMAERQYDRAIQTWQQVIELQGRSAVTHARLADALIAAKRLEDAASQLQLAISANGGADVHRRLADLYAAMGRLDDSARERRRYLERRLKELTEQAGAQ
jgi:tetratricopeptide (TPR) repeat protein